jgi:hypothetical protein
MKDLWEHKTQYQRKEEHTVEDFTVEGIWAEFGKSRISVSRIKGDVRNFRVGLSLAKRKDFEGFQSSIRQSFQSTTHILYYNAKEFDIPFLARSCDY